MKFKIQEFATGTPPEREDEVYFSLALTDSSLAMNRTRLVLRASNTKGDPGQNILVIREDGKVYRPSGDPIKGLAYGPDRRILLGG